MTPHGFEGNDFEMICSVKTVLIYVSFASVIQVAKRPSPAVTDALAESA